MGREAFSIFQFIVSLFIVGSAVLSARGSRQVGCFTRNIFWNSSTFSLFALHNVLLNIAYLYFKAYHFSTKWDFTQSTLLLRLQFGTLSVLTAGDSRWWFVNFQKIVNIRFQPYKCCRCDNYIPEHRTDVFIIEFEWTVPQVILSPLWGLLECWWNFYSRFNGTVSLQEKKTPAETSAPFTSFVQFVSHPRTYDVSRNASIQENQGVWIARLYQDRELH